MYCPALVHAQDVSKPVPKVSRVPPLPSARPFRIAPPRSNRGGLCNAQLRALQKRKILPWHKVRSPFVLRFTMTPFSLLLKPRERVSWRSDVSKYIISPAKILDSQESLPSGGIQEVIMHENRNLNLFMYGQAVHQCWLILRTSGISRTVCMTATKCALDSNEAIYSLKRSTIQWSKLDTDVSCWESRGEWYWCGWRTSVQTSQESLGTRLGSNAFLYAWIVRSKVWNGWRLRTFWSLV